MEIDISIIDSIGTKELAKLLNPVTHNHKTDEVATIQRSNRHNVRDQGTTNNDRTNGCT
jgi:nucleoside-triphosphatase THEP1